MQTQKKSKRTANGCPMFYCTNSCVGRFISVCCPNIGCPFDVQNFLLRSWRFNQKLHSVCEVRTCGRIHAQETGWQWGVRSVYYARAAYVFSAGIKCRHWTPGNPCLVCWAASAYLVQKLNVGTGYLVTMLSVLGCFAYLELQCTSPRIEISQYSTSVYLVLWMNEVSSMYII